MHLSLHYVWACLWIQNMPVYICASCMSSTLQMHSILMLSSDTAPNILIAIFCLEVVLFIFPVYFFLSFPFLSSHIFVLSVHVYFFFFLFYSCRCFDWQGYCSGGWCLDTGWHCTAPWAHSQIREDIRNPSLLVLFNHAGWRGNVFMEWTVEQIHCTFVCVYSGLVCVVNCCFSLLSSHDV